MATHSRRSGHMTGQAGSNHQVGRLQHSEGRFAHLLNLILLESVRTSAFNPDSGSFCSGLGRRVALLRSNCSVMFLRARKVQSEFALPSRSRIQLGFLSSALTALKSCMDHLVPIAESPLGLPPCPYSISMLSQLHRGDTQETTMSHLVVPYLASDILELTQPDLTSAANSQAVP